MMLRCICRLGANPIRKAVGQSIGVDMAVASAGSLVPAIQAERENHGSSILQLVRELSRSQCQRTDETPSPVLHRL